MEETIAALIARELDNLEGVIESCTESEGSKTIACLASDMLHCFFKYHTSRRVGAAVLWTK